MNNCTACTVPFPFTATLVLPSRSGTRLIPSATGSHSNGLSAKGIKYLMVDVVPFVMLVSVNPSKVMVSITVVSPRLYCLFAARPGCPRHHRGTDPGCGTAWRCPGDQSSFVVIGHAGSCGGSAAQVCPLPLSTSRTGHVTIAYKQHTDWQRYQDQ